jgi:glutathione S-transferase
MHCMPEAADDFKTIGRNGMALFDQILADRPYLAGTRFSVADIVLYALIDFFAGVGQPRDPDHKNLAAWFERVDARESAEASLHPAAKAGGMRA